MPVLNEVLLEERLRNFNPEPLVPPQQEQQAPIEIPIVQQDISIVDMATVNYLNFLNNKELKKVAEDTIRKYGVGTCGPRAFYGTTDAHLELEETLAEFLHMEECILYSYGFVAISSGIAAYCRKHDTIFVDEHANFAIEQGWTASKSTVVKFSHNDAEDFRKKLSEIDSKEKKKSRKFLIIEGISWKTGKICPLPDFIKVAEEFKVRVFVEETYTLGVLGDKGRGMLEHFDLKSDKVDMVFGTLEGALGSIGGFCAGSFSVIEHQRLSGSGYVFSASLPTYLARTAIKAIELIGEKPKELREMTENLHDILEKIGFIVDSDPSSPFKVVKIEPEDTRKRVHALCKEKGVPCIYKEDCLVLNINCALRHRPSRYAILVGAFMEAIHLIE